MLGDADGVVVIPTEREQEVLEAAFDVEQAEEGIRRLVHEGRRLDDARREYGYHRLQHREES
jgi:regulator of RNase E activity RraA